MEIKQAHYFLEIVAAGSFSAAAEGLYISQSTLSKQIMALEEELGVQLFNRSKRQIVVTPAGERFALYARTVYETYQAMMAEIADYRPTSASLSVVAIPVIAQYGIPAYIAQFNGRYPHIPLALKEREAWSILPALYQHQYDVAFMRDYQLNREQVASLEIAHDQLQVILSHQHPLVGKSTLALAELAEENFIMFDKGTTVHELTLAACHEAGFHPKVAYASLRAESIIGMVRANKGVALMMAQVFAYAEQSGVTAVSLAQPVESHVVLAYLKHKRLSASARLFISFMEEVVGGKV
ncbi:MAG: LysR family transcriptional regulator [Chloroflexi bacterium]|nr:LysR family transcriptional regulator [Chloroflexota bacterium]